MTNKPMLSVERELLSSICDDFEAGKHSKACEGASKLRAILDDKYRAPPINIHCHATNVQIIRNEDGSYTIRNKVDQEQNPKITGLVYSFSADETAPAAQNQGEPVVYTQFLTDVMTAAGLVSHGKQDKKFAERLADECARLQVEHFAFRERPAPVADHTQCEECKGWGYHENHYEGGGTECGECGGSGNATVVMVMVMPDRMEVEPFTTIDRGSKNYKAGYNAAIVEVAKLNGLKP